jgi:3-oxoacyl-[acyl-carrier-protein] synthase II
MDSHTRVVVTGMGIVAPNGIGLDDYWDSLIHCKSGIGPITLFDTTDFPVKIAGEVRHFSLVDHFGSTVKPKRIARQTQLAMVACKMALEHAGLTAQDLRQVDRVNLTVGICSGAADIMGAATELIVKYGPERVRPYMVGVCQPHAISAALLPIIGTKTCISTLSSACPSGLDAVAHARRTIQRGETDIAIAGAADSPLNPTGFAGFMATGTLSRLMPPDSACRPFDLQRGGVALSEGAGFVILERLETALARGATPYMEVLGSANSADVPISAGMSMSGLRVAMQDAIRNAGLYPSQIDYICANAPGMPGGDDTEVKFIKAIFGNHAYRIPVSSIRGVTGHALAAAGMFQVIACGLMMRHDKIVPTAHLHCPDPACDLDHVPLAPRHAKLRTVLINGHGMGGENSVLILGRV